MPAAKQNAIPRRQLDNAARMLKAVAHPLRLRILEALADGEKCVGDIVDATGAKPALTSQQLGLMRDRGLLDSRREGSHVYYRIARPPILKILDCVRRCCQPEA
jgi:ArsR family transcriptional regulator